MQHFLSASLSLYLGLEGSCIGLEFLVLALTSSCGHIYHCYTNFAGEIQCHMLVI